MGGKSGTTTSSVSIPPDVLKRYNAVNAYASDVAQTPFQPYQGQFVAGLTPTQQAGIQGTSQYANTAQPYYGAATQQLMNAQASAQPGISAAYENVGSAQDVGQQYAQGATQGIGAALQSAQPYQAGATQAAFMGAQGIQPGQLNTAQYMNPYTQAVANTTYQALQQQQQEQMGGQLGNAIRSGAFGGDRAALAAINLGRQQQLGMSQAMAPIYQQGYGQALQTAQQQQGVQLSADQANRAAMQNLAQQLQGIGQQGYSQQMGAAQQLGSLGQQQYGQGMGAAAQLAGLAQQGYGMGAATSQALAGLGSGAQQAGLQGAQAQMGAGTLEQQTQQADLTARYQQFLQERGYPFQTAQFLANIAMGTGALSGSTTTTQQPMPFFSDRRVKHDVKEIGKTNDGQPIYSFKYNGDNSTQIGLMAQDVEKKHPDAVGEYGGIKTVDYKKATEGAERPERYAGGIVPASMGGAVNEPGAYNRGGYSYGGDVDPNDLQALLQQQQTALGPFGESGLYGQGHAEGTPFGQSGGIVPKQRLHVPKLMISKDRPEPIKGLGGQALDLYDEGKKAYGNYQEAKDIWSKLSDKLADSTNAPAEMGPLMEGASWAGNRGGLVPRKHFVQGGTAFSNPYKKYDFEEGQVPDEVLELDKPAELQKAPTPSSSGSSGSGLGTALSLGKFVLGFLKDGGAVPRGHLADGGVYDPTTGELLSKEDTTQTATDTPDVYSLGLAPAVAPRFRQFEKIAKEEGAKGIKPGEMERSAERSAMYDLTMPEGAPRAKPYSSGHNYRLATDFSGVTPSDVPAMRKAAAATGLTLGADFKNPDLPHVQYGKGSFSGLFPQYGQDVEVGPGFGATEHSGAVPEEASNAAYDKAREMLASKGIDPSSEKGQGMMDSLMGYMRKNQEWLVPAGSFLRGMVQSKSPYLGGALLEGLGSGMEAVGTAQQQIANLNLSRAQAMKESLGLVAQRFKMLPGGKYYDTVEQREISAQERDQIMRSLGLPVGATTNVADKAKEVLQNAGIEQPTQGATEPKTAVTDQGQPKPDTATTTVSPEPTKVPELPKEPQAIKMSDKYPDIPIVESQTSVAAQRILSEAEKNPDVLAWKSRVSEYQSRADEAQRSADELRGRGDNAQAETYQKQADALRTSMAQAQQQMLLTRDNIAKPEISKLEGQTRVGQETDNLLLRQAAEQYPQIQRAKYRLSEMRHNFEKLPSTGWLAPGQFGEQKADFAKSINDFANTFGAKEPFDQAQIAAGTAIQKDSVRLGEDLAKSLGNNNAAAIINQSVQATPSLANAELGWKLLLGSLDQANKFMEDQTSYMNKYWEVNQTLQGAQESFSKTHPVDQYVKDAMVSIVPPADADALKSTVGTPNETVARQRIDKKYGRGMSNMILGQ